MTEKRQYWYLITRGECPMCGADTEYRERVYGARPEKWEDRHVFLSDAQSYDHCIEMAAIYA